MSRLPSYLKKTAVNLPPVHAAYVAYHAQVSNLFVQEVLRQIIQTFVEKDCNFQPADFSRFVQHHVVPTEGDERLVEVLKAQLAGLLCESNHALMQQPPPPKRET